MDCGRYDGNNIHLPQNIYLYRQVYILYISLCFLAFIYISTYIYYIYFSSRSKQNKKNNVFFSIPIDYYQSRLLLANSILSNKLIAINSTCSLAYHTSSNKLVSVEFRWNLRILFSYKLFLLLSESCTCSHGLELLTITKNLAAPLEYPT